MKCPNCYKEVQSGETFCSSCKGFCVQPIGKIVPFSNNPMFPSASRIIFDPINYGVIAIKTKRDDAS